MVLLTAAGRQDKQHPAVPGGNAPTDGGDGFFLVGAEGYHLISLDALILSNIRFTALAVTGGVSRAPISAPE